MSMKDMKLASQLLMIGAVVAVRPAKNNRFHVLAAVFAEKPLVSGNKFHILHYVIASERSERGNLFKRLLRRYTPRNDNWIPISPVPF